MSAFEIQGSLPARPPKRKVSELYDPLYSTSIQGLTYKKLGTIPRVETIQTYISPPSSSIEQWLEGLEPESDDSYHKIHPGHDSCLILDMANPGPSDSLFGQQGNMPPPATAPSRTTSEAPTDSGVGSAAEDVDGTPDRDAVRQPQYREVLKKHGVKILNFGFGAATEVMERARDILETASKGCQTSGLSDEDVKAFQQSLDEIADKPEDDAVESLIKCFSARMRQNGVVNGVKVFGQKGVPHRKGCVQAMARPYCDRTYGYAEEIMGFEYENILQCKTLFPFIFPSKENYFPFFAVEFEAPSQGGTLWVAENQCAGFGAHCLKSMEQLFNITKRSLSESEVTDTLVFSCTMDYTTAVFWVHWYIQSGDEMRLNYRSAPVRTLNLRESEHVKELHTILRNINEWACSTRLVWIRRLLTTLRPYAQEQQQLRKSKSRQSSQRAVRAVCKD
ncbi:MAG: hypothetical protein LQ340_001487 [Diploschistes diacapsis]|nr:MAG: hypothetical protein LQ340_001487 [Diploschistes diacapsis]